MFMTDEHIADNEGGLSTHISGDMLPFHMCGFNKTNIGKSNLETFVKKVPLAN